MKKLWIGILAGALLLSLGGVFAYNFIYDRKLPNFTGEVELFVYPGMELTEIQDSILSSGAVKKPASLKRVMAGLDGARVGHYRIDGSCSSMYVGRMLANGWQSPVNLTLSGSIRTPAALCRKIGSQMLADSASVAAFISSADSLDAYGIEPRMLFTRIIPDTYQMLWTSSVREIFNRLDRESEAWWTPERVSAALKQGLTPEEASTLASIVDGETRYKPEMPSIAAVYLNRLRTGMKLQADPTVAYCFDYQPRRILKRHLEVDSPYNTYKNFGLPPGPISCPPKACLEAVLNPDSHAYLFFCADPSFNGSHRFATTYSEHLVNARAFQKALTERQRARK